MYNKVSLEDVDGMEVPIEENQGILKPVGYILKSKEMTPNIWHLDEGKHGARHKQTEQEEVYFLLEGRLEFDIEGDTVELKEDDFLVVEPTAWRKITALEDSTMLAIGAPRVDDDHVLED